MGDTRAVNEHLNMFSVFLPAWLFHIYSYQVEMDSFPQWTILDNDKIRTEFIITDAALKMRIKAHYKWQSSAELI